MKRKKKALSLLLSAALLVGMLPVSLGASAATERKSIMLGTDGISTWSEERGYDYLYFGRNDGDIVKWRVLDTQTNTGLSDGLFLLSEDLFERQTFRSDYTAGNAYQGSDVQKWCQTFYESSFSAPEKDAVQKTVKSDGAFQSQGSSYASSANILQGDQVFLLSAEEASNSRYGFINDDARKANVSGNDMWWLRSPYESSSYFAGCVYNGQINLLSLHNDYPAPRPAFNLTKDMVLFTSAAPGGKPAGELGTLNKIPDYTGHEWKATLLNRAYRNFTVSEVAVEGAPGGRVPLNYTSAAYGDEHYISAILTEDGGSDSLYYGQLAQPGASSGNCSFTVPADLAPGRYILKVFLEQRNGDYQTDYASFFQDVVLTVTEPAGTAEDPYLIYTAQQLKAFRDKVNGGEVEICAKLMVDINLNPTLDQSKFTVEQNDNGAIKSIQYDGSETIPAFEEWTPIGGGDNYKVDYQGTFDGGGHTISGLYMNKNTGVAHGLFGSAEQAQIKNLGVVNSFVKGYAEVGGILGHDNGLTVVERCYFSGVVCGASSVGGIVGQTTELTYASKKRTEVIQCYNTGKIIGKENVGGIVGYLYSSDLDECYNAGEVTGDTNVGGLIGYMWCSEPSYCEVLDCYNAGSVTGSEEVAAVIGSYYHNYVLEMFTIENCYYLEGTAGSGIGQNGSQSENIRVLTASQLRDAKSFANWNFNYVWKIGEYDEIPVRPILLPNPEEIVLDLGDGSVENPYKIYTAKQLKDFRDKVNGVETGACAMLMNDIVLNPGLFDEDGTYTPENGEALEQWTPIGTDNIRYAGTFDGGGHTVSGVYVNNNANYQGLFGYVHQGTVKNVTVTNSYIQGNNCIGGIAGELLNGTVQNCAFSGTVKGGIDVGGVVGSNSLGTVSGCYNTGAVEGVNSVGGVVGSVANKAVVRDCYNVGSVQGNDLVGGVVGYGSIDTTVVGCYNAGAVGSLSKRVGGVVGDCFESTIQNCFYTKGGGSYGTAITKAQLGDPATFTDWDFTTVWQMGDPHGRPILRENPEPPPEIITPSYIVTIPAKLNLSQGSGDFTVTADEVILDTASQLQILLTAFDGALTFEEDSVAYELRTEAGAAKAGDILLTVDGQGKNPATGAQTLTATVTGQPKYTNPYTDWLVFTVQTVEKGA